MALPVTILAAAGVAGHQPPVKSSKGDYYVIIRASDTAIDAYKATDPTSSFSVQDAASNPAAFATLEVLSYRQWGNEIRIATYDGAIYEYHVFDMSTDTWTITDEAIETPTDLPTLGWISIDSRSDGDVIVAYAGDTDQVMGGKKERVDYGRREGGTWTVGVALDAGGDIHYGNPNEVKGALSDSVHILWLTTSNTTDPPTAWTDVEARTLDSANSLSTTVSSTSDTGGTLLGMQNGISYADAGTVRIKFYYSIDNDDSRVFNASENGSNNVQALGSQLVANDLVHINGELGGGTLAVEADTSYVLTIQTATQDIIYIDSISEAAWANKVLEKVSITCNYISSNIYQRGTNTLLAYLYDDAGVQKYDEKVLSTGLSYTQLDHASFDGLVNSHVGPFEI